MLMSDRQDEKLGIVSIGGHCLYLPAHSILCISTLVGNQIFEQNLITNPYRYSGAWVGLRLACIG